VVDALDHVADDFAGSVPDAKLLAELGVEGFEERLVEVVDGIFLVEGSEEARLHAVEGVGGVVEHLNDLDRIESAALDTA
jgi:hypothetical protein